MILLHYGCYCSEPRVSPKTWNKKNASCDQDWFIHYRFYDPRVVDEAGKLKPKQVSIRGMNEYKSVQDRRDVCKELIKNELIQLRDKGYNPHTGAFSLQSEVFYEIDPGTPFMKALWLAMAKVVCEPETRIDMEGTLRGVELAAAQLGFLTIPISKISRKYIKAILDHLPTMTRTKTFKNGKTMVYKWSASRHNKYRAWLMRLFKDLVQMEAIESNPVRDIFQKKEVKAKRTTLTREQRMELNTNVRERWYELWRLLHVFFHSGSRKTELCKVKGRDVDLVNQTCTYTVLKGGKREVVRPIKDIVLPLWQELMTTCGPDDYLMGVQLVPGKIKLSPHRISELYLEHIKKPFGIDADFYALKHLNTAETIDALSHIKSASTEASKLNGHTTPVITIGTYDVHREQRENDLIKSVSNTL